MLCLHAHIFLFYTMFTTHNMMFVLLLYVCTGVEWSWCSKGIFLSVTENIDFPLIPCDCTENKCLYNMNCHSSVCVCTPGYNIYNSFGWHILVKLDPQLRFSNSFFFNLSCLFNLNTSHECTLDGSHSWWLCSESVFVCKSLFLTCFHETFSGVDDADKQKGFPRSQTCLSVCSPIQYKPGTTPKTKVIDKEEETSAAFKKGAS